MAIGTILNVVLSLLFLFLLLSLMTSVFQELVSGTWGKRGQGLRKAIGQMLGDPEIEELAKTFYDHPLIKGLLRPGWDIGWLSWLHGLLPFLRARMPAYIEPAVFADTLLDILRRHGALDGGRMQPALAAHWQNAKQDEAAFRTSLMAWFTAATDRQSGLYKRDTQRMLFLYGFLLAVLLNVDTLLVARYLWDGGNATRSAEIAAQAVAYAKQNPNGPPPGNGSAEQDFAGLLKTVQDLKLPIGWDQPSPCAIARATVPLPDWAFALVCDTAIAKRQTTATAPAAPSVTPATWLGWILTALAISVGAQFWFDTLGKVIGLRAAGKKPAETAG
jgi:hypothetical protein